MKVAFTEWDKHLQRQFARIVLKWISAVAVLAGIGLGRGKIARWVGKIKS